MKKPGFKTILMMGLGALGIGLGVKSLLSKKEDEDANDEANEDIVEDEEEVEVEVEA